MRESARPLFHRTWFNMLRTVVYASVFVLFFFWLALTVRALDPNFPFTLPQAAVPLGIALMFAGGALGIVCISTFVVHGRGTPALFDPPRQFVAIGPYRYVRNPMYIGGFALLLGFGLDLRSVSILLLAIMAVLACHLVVVLHEEPSLTRKFGFAYEDYLRTVSRWLPRIPRTRASQNSAGTAR